MNLTEREVEFLRSLCAACARGRLMVESDASMRGHNEAVARELFFKLGEIPVR